MTEQAGSSLDATAARVEQARAVLALPTLRRATSLRDGLHSSTLQGHGQDFDDLALYTPGDDVGDIDWKSSARTGVPVIKRFQRDAAAPVLLVVDSGRTMAATAASGETKTDIARQLAAIVGTLALDRGDPVGLIAGDAERLVRVPPRSGRANLELMLRRVDEVLTTEGPAPDFTRVLNRVRALSRTPALVVLVTDAASLTPAQAPAITRLLGGKHRVIALVVADADPLDPQSAPSRDVLDGWPVPGVLRGNRKVREALARHRAEQTLLRDGMLRRLGVPQATVASSEHAITALAAALDRRRRGTR
ncbi:DUF58 domain-containing protein [Cellulomonas denverensis]|uniref:DUF58 domain-containing protein n=1 Tax=Cellulomonas denverensis TaxID=264297 RepID=A0A7X6KT01_9CELL|nr:DUF58 domain-containing protein [Cellulomonas denverensis]NKY21741.1 DUF58 domain-containing protein [Cellulomonas denverensis]GIG25600.1 hypothetical protein Cde04nite_18440 [Cellulomonas denverensis]